MRERWPLPTDDAEERRAVYARGVRAALNHVFNQPAHVQMHTHMCYGDFGDIVPLWGDAGVDVASIEFSRSKDDSYIRQFYELFDDGHLQIGPGVFDVHSPHSPGTGTMDERLEHFLGFMDGERPVGQPRLRPQDARLAGDRAAARRHGGRRPQPPAGRRLTAMLSEPAGWRWWRSIRPACRR